MGGGKKNVVLCAAKMIETHILATGNEKSSTITSQKLINTLNGHKKDIPGGPKTVVQMITVNLFLHIY